MRIPSVNMQKLENRSKMVVHLGKEPGTKAYRLYDPVGKKVHVSRDVVFEETKSWVWEQGVEKETRDENIFVVFGMGSAEARVNDTGRIENSTRKYLGSTEESGYVSNLELQTESPHSANSYVSNTDSEASSEVLKYKTLSEVYENAEQVELNDEELFLVAPDEPANYKQASKERLWRQAMEREIEAVEQNKTWSSTMLPPGQKVIGLNWVYKLKKDTNGNIVKHKARIVAKGYVQ